MYKSDIAKVAHEVNRAFCASLGDMSQLDWENSEQWVREAALAGVQSIIEDPTMTPERLHKSWLREKTESGWVYGPVKDARLKQHPCMIAYESLPVEQRSKDYIFVAVVNSLYPHLV